MPHMTDPLTISKSIMWTIIMWQGKRNRCKCSKNRWKNSVFDGLLHQIRWGLATPILRSGIRGEPVVATHIFAKALVPMVMMRVLEAKIDDSSSRPIRKDQGNYPWANNLQSPPIKSKYQTRRSGSILLKFKGNIWMRRSKRRAHHKYSRSQLR